MFIPSTFPGPGARVAAVCSLLALTGCMLPTYVPPAGTVLTSAKLYGMGQPHMCADGQRYSLDVTEKDGKASQVQLPVGKRIAIWSHISTQGYQTIITCNPMLSVVPEQGVTLAIHSGVAGSRCFIEAAREDARTPTGIALETSLGAPAC